MSASMQQPPSSIGRSRRTFVLTGLFTVSAGQRYRYIWFTGHSVRSIWQVTRYQPTTTESLIEIPEVTDWKYHGCYDATTVNPLFDVLVTYQNLTPKECIRRCWNYSILDANSRPIYQNFMFAGLSNSNPDFGTQCYCGNQTAVREFNTSMCWGARNSYWQRPVSDQSLQWRIR